MKLKHAQNGVTVITIALSLGLLAFVVMTALKLFPVYMEGFTVKSSVEGLVADKSREYVGALSVREAVMKRLDINDVTRVGGNDIKVVRDDGKYLVDVNYEVRIPYLMNIDLVLKFENHAEVPAS